MPYPLRHNNVRRHTHEGPMATMTYSPQGLALTKQSESCRLHAYQDGGGVWTIGYGHTGHDVCAGLVWTANQAGAALALNVQGAVAAVNRDVTVKLTQCQFDALVDFTYNCGVGALQSSTLLKMVNSGNFPGAVLEFGKWIRDHFGVIEPGLVIRRDAEARMFRGV